MLKNLKRLSKPLGGHYEVTSGLIQNTPIELKLDMNDPEVNLNIVKIPQVNSRSLRGQFRFDTKCSYGADILYE